MQKISNTALLVSLISLLLRTRFEVFQYVTAISMSILYISFLTKEWKTKGSFPVLSGVLCVLAVMWLICGAMFQNLYWSLLGQIVIYGFLLNTGKQISGKWNKKLLFTASLNMTVKVFGRIYPSAIANIISFIIYIITVFLFLDPILEMISINHCNKRLKSRERRRL